MKKLITLLFILIMVLTLFGCQEDSQKNEEVSSNVESELGSTGDADDQDTEDADEMTFDIVELPVEYPEDIVPIIDSGDLEFGGVNEQEMVLKVYCKDEPIEVFNYYLEIMKSSENFKQDELADVYFLDGIIEGNKISIKITEDTYYDGYLTSLTINVK